MNHGSPTRPIRLQIDRIRDRHPPRRQAATMFLLPSHFVVRLLNSEEIKGTQMGSFGVLGVIRKSVFKLDLHHNKLQRKVLMKVSGLSGVDSITMDMMVKNLTLIGNVDPVDVVAIEENRAHSNSLPSWAVLLGTMIPQYNLSTYRAYNPQLNLHSPW